MFFYKAESSRKMDAHVNFQYTGCLMTKNVENIIGPSYFTVKLLVYKTTSDMFKTIWVFKTRELIMNDCFAV